MDWKEVWQALTGEAVQIQSISVKRNDTTTADFVELFNPGNFTACAQDLIPGMIYDMSVSFFMNILQAASSWDLPSIRELAEHPGVSIVTGDMCRWGMHLPEESSNQGTEHSVLVKKPTKWMTNCSALASLLGVRCTGGHEHSKLEGSKRTAHASKYPTALVNGILNTIKKVKSRLIDANHARDPVHFMIPEILRQTEDEISLVCNRKQMSIYDMQPPPQISADQILVRRTVDRRTGVVIAEEMFMI